MYIMHDLCRICNKIGAMEAWKIRLICKQEKWAEYIRGKRKGGAKMVFM